MAKVSLSDLYPTKPNRKIIAEEKVFEEESDTSCVDKYLTTVFFVYKWIGTYTFSNKDTNFTTENGEKVTSYKISETLVLDWRLPLDTVYEIFLKQFGVRGIAFNTWDNNLEIELLARLLEVEKPHRP